MKKKKFDVYEMVTDRILEALENGTVPWRKPWRGGTAAGSPVNLKSKKAYRGINVFVLHLQGFSSRYWATFKQAKDLGGKVRKGSKGTPVVFWKWIDKKGKDDDGNEIVLDRYPILRYYTVFNLDQIDGIDDPDAKAADDTPAKFNPIEAAEKIVDEMPNRPEITHNEPRAYYRPSTDTVNMPKPELFDVPAEYYSTIFHELTHSTGHESRLNRDGITKLAAFGDDNYSQEELVAEMGAAFLCGHAGIENETIDNSAAYIDGWRKKLSTDKKLVVYAAAQAQKAADYILDNNNDN